MPFFSICIPAYKNIAFLKRLLESVFRQIFTDYEVVITDDSPDDGIESFLETQYHDKAYSYYRNETPLGTPENWNECIRKASGTWIKLMHDDDWFCSDEALQVLFDTIQKQPGSFYFSAYYNIYLDEHQRKELVNVPAARWKRVLQFPPNLYARNIIGPPSVTLVKSDVALPYETRMKWLVDIDYYIRVMKEHRPVYIPMPLINVGMGSTQVTTYTHNKPEVEIPEGLLMLEKIGLHAFRHILFYDAWWRLLRNLNIRSGDDLRRYANGAPVPDILPGMIRLQKTIPAAVLKFGPVSKTLMFYSWLKSKTIRLATH